MNESKAEINNNYRPEIYLIEELNEVNAAYLHSLIRVLRWIVQIPRKSPCLDGMAEQNIPTLIPVI